MFVSELEHLPEERGQAKCLTSTSPPHRQWGFGVASPLSFLMAESHCGGQKLGISGVSTVFWRSSDSEGERERPQGAGPGASRRLDVSHLRGFLVGQVYSWGRQSFSKKVGWLHIAFKGLNNAFCQTIPWNGFPGECIRKCLERPPATGRGRRSENVGCLSRNLTWGGASFSVYRAHIWERAQWAHTHVPAPGRPWQRTFPTPLRLTCTHVQSTDPCSSGANPCSDFCHHSFLLLSFLKIESFAAHCCLVTFAHHFVVGFRYLLSYSCVVGRSLWHFIVMESVKYITYQLREFCWNSHTCTV